MTDTATPRPALPRAYWRMWAASATSNLGDGMYLVAMPLLAARLTRSEIQIALLTVLATLPWLLLSIPVGVLVDRLDRKRLMVVANLFRTAVMGMLAVMIAVDGVEIWMLWCTALALGVGEVVFDNATMALMPHLVSEEQLPRANGLLYAAELGTNGFLGHPLGGVLFTIAATLPFVVDAVSFAVAAVAIAGIAGSFRVAASTGGVPAADMPRPTLRSQLGDGWRFLWRHDILRPLAVAFMLVSIAFQMPFAVLVLFARETLGLSERGYAVFLTVITVGAVLGGVFGDRLVARLGRSRSMYLALGTWVTALAVTAAVPRIGVVTLAAIVEAMATALWNMTTVSLRQVLVPPHLFGRVNSVYRWCGWGMVPVGALLGGLIASVWGLRAPYVVAAVLIGVALVLVLTRIDRSQVDDATASMLRPAPTA